MQDQQQHSRPKTEWVEAQKFTDGEWTVRLTKPVGAKYVRFNWEILQEGREPGRFFSKFFPIWSEGQGKINVRPFSETVGRLLVQAERWATEQLQQQEDERIAWKISREERNAPMKSSRQDDRRGTHRFGKSKNHHARDQRPE
jgi:hypothetical protein